MFSSVIARSTRLARPTTFLRRGGHGTPSYNEPGGYLFSEKVQYHHNEEGLVLIQLFFFRSTEKREYEYN
jgi:hypothetical protein